jgi:hypothetical protein
MEGFFLPVSREDVGAVLYSNYRLPNLPAKNVEYRM